MNNDKFTDLITTNDNQNAVTVYYFDDSTGKYSNRAEFSIRNGRIESIVPTKSQQELQGLMLGIKKVDGSQNVHWYTQTKTSWGN